MLRHIISSAPIFNRIVQNNTVSLLAPVGQMIINLQQQRYIKKHWNPKWKKLRKQKVIKIDLPNYHEQDNENLSEEEVRSKMKEKGILPVRQWVERPVFLSSTGGIFEPYVPPEGDGKFSAITKVGAKQKIEFLGKKGKSMWAIRKIKSFDEEFHTTDFSDQSRDIYIKAHKALVNKNYDELIKYVTEKAYPIMIHNVENKTLIWKFVESLEPARVVHARCTKVLTEDDVFAQVTVRFHTQQILVVYDRFGRLMHGNDFLKKDVLEYIVFEKHLANEYGKWRIHDKIIPQWMAPRDPSAKTYVMPPQKETEEEEPVESAMKPLEEAKVEPQVV